ncbi:MAG: restriction endonuclease subunit S [Planctomycetota bacterium]
MSNKHPAKLTPQLRFPEFRDDPPWDSRHLGRLFLERTDTGGDGLPLLSLTDAEGLIRQEDSGRRDNSNADKSRYARVCPGDIAYNTMRMWEGRSALAHEEGLISPAYTVCTPRQGQDSDFFAHYFKTAVAIEQFRRFSQGLVKDTLNLKYDRFAKIRLYTTSPEEQRKIAACLGSLGDWIAAEERALEALRLHKAGLMQQLFPRPGETRPRLRFPEFRNAADWKPTPIDKLASIKSGGTPSKSNPHYWGGSIPWVSAKDMKTVLLDDSKSHIAQLAVDEGARLVPAGTLLMLTRGMTLMKDVPICLLQRPMTFNQDLKALSPRKGTRSDFLIYLLIANKPSLRSLVDIAGHGTGRLDTDKIKRLELSKPEPAEQQQIADCLAALDAHLTSQAGKLAALRQHKHALMQQLFPSSRRAQQGSSQ